MAQDQFTASESDEQLEVFVCRNQQIDFSVTVIVSPVTIESAAASELTVLPFVPESDPHSPNRAG